VNVAADRVTKNGLYQVFVLVAHRRHSRARIGLHSS
jgi:hypothetical protein